MGTLNLYLQRAQTGKEQLLFQESGDHGDRWLRGREDVYSSVDFFLIFEAVQDFETFSDMALDDIRLLPYPCRSVRESASFTAFPLPLLPWHFSLVIANSYRNAT